jgi:outer membrane protein assembly factor BamB
VLDVGEQLWPNQSLWSADRRLEFIYQGDGHLVLYDQGRPVWSSGTAGTSPGRIMMQHDGHLVMYDASGQPVWESGTAGHPGAWLIVQNDGNVVIYSENGQPLWATNTAH